MRHSLPPNDYEYTIKRRRGSVESTELFALRNAKKRYEAAFIRIAKAHGIDSPLVLMAMAENDEENYAEILARHIEQSMANDQVESRRGSSNEKPGGLLR